jgi:hypothetical protein
MKEIFAYKVVRERTDGLYSSWVRHPDAVTKYKIGKWTGRRKGCGPLGTFKKLKDAKEFQFQFCRVCGVIYRCKVKVSKYDSFWFCTSDSKTFSIFKNTIFADKVMLLKRVK